MGSHSTKCLGDLSWEMGNANEAWLAPSYIDRLCFSLVGWLVFVV